jgi:glycerol-3-phosphate dehydrogenase
LVQGKAGSTADLSRRHTVYEIADGILGITGGKMTTYRRMAKDATDRVAASLGNNVKCKTKWIRLGTADHDRLVATAADRSHELGVDEGTTAHLVRTYGDRAVDILAIARDEGLTSPLVPGYQPLAAEAVYCAREEMAVHLNDLLARRTRLALVDRNAGIGQGARALDIMAGACGWSRAVRKTELEAHRVEVERERGLGVASPVPPRRSLMDRARRLRTG